MKRPWRKKITPAFHTLNHEVVYDLTEICNISFILGGGGGGIYLRKMLFIPAIQNKKSVTILAKQKKKKKSFTIYTRYVNY